MVDFFLGFVVGCLYDATAVVSSVEYAKEHGLAFHYVPVFTAVPYLLFECGNGDRKLVPRVAINRLFQLFILVSYLLWNTGRAFGLCFVTGKPKT